MKFAKPILIAAGILAALLLLLALVIPPVAKHYVNKHSKELIGRQVRLEGLYLNLFTGYTRLTGFQLAEQNDRDTFVAFDTLIVDMSLFRLLANEIRINQIQLVNPMIRLLQNGEHFNFDDLLTLGQTDTLANSSSTPIAAATVPTDSLTPPPSVPASENTSVSASETTTVSSESSTVALSNIEIRGGHIFYQDEIRHSVWEMENLGLRIPGVYFSGKNTEVGLALNFNDGGHLQTAIQYNLEAGNYLLDIRLENFSIAPIRPYLTDFLDIHSIQGVLNTHLNIEGSTQHLTDLNLQGMLSLHHLLLTDNRNTSVFSTDSILIEMEKINPEKSIFHFDTIAIHKLQTGFDLRKDGSTLSDLLKTTSADTAATPTTPSPTTSQPAVTEVSPDLHINAFRLTQSLFTFNDHTLHKPFTFNLENISMTADRLSLHQKNKAKITTTLTNGGSITLQYEGKPDDIGNTDLLLSIKNLDLKTFTPYSLQYFGYPLKQGILSFNSINGIRHNMLEGRNNLNIAKCEVESKQKSPQPEYNIPLKTALYLIKDKNDLIKMDLPVKGNINSPEFSYKKIIFKTFTNLLIKVAVSPVSFLANSLGFSPDQLKNIPFEATQSDFTPAQLTQVNQLAEIAKAKPEMVLVLEQFVNLRQSQLALARFYVKRNYYLQQHPEKNLQTLLPIDYTKIAEIKGNDVNFLAYVNQQAGEEMKTAGTEQQILSLADETQLNELCHSLLRRRNQQLTEYLLRQGVPAQCLRISTASDEKLTAYNGKNLYTVNLIFEGDEPDPALTASVEESTEF